MRAGTPPTAAILLLVLLSVSCGSDSGGVIPECGNDAIETGEECDDGNPVSCDGCSADCQDEIGYVCGDGTVNAACGEECDDGNTDPWDGCDADCQAELCGNGQLDPGEECDDDNTISCDGCSVECLDEIGYVCGDGIPNSTCGEECDDFNTTSCDGCSSDCTIETGFICGDGTLNPICGEECDDGNTTPGDGCDENCELETPPLHLDGDYSVDVDGQDTCGFGTGMSTTPMRVIELAPVRFLVNIPVGGAGGECDAQEFERQGNTLTLIRSWMQQIGGCTVQVDSTTVLTFFDDGSVSGFEDTTLSEAGGNCSALSLPCDINLALDGQDCAACFSCVNPASGAALRGIGLFGGAAGATVDALKAP